VLLKSPYLWSLREAELSVIFNELMSEKV
jgi:hypothetical protein